jgi:hypothetical protein
MARKVVIVSDLSGQDIPDDERVELRVLEFPELSQPVRLDASKTEVDRLKLEAKPFALLELVTADGAIERIAVDAGELARNVQGDLHEIMSTAEAVYQSEPVVVPPRRGRRPRDEGAAPRGDKIDYTAPDRYGQLHRGRLNEAEIQLVRDNPEQASRNREAQGHPPIDWDDAKERTRYGLSPTDVNDIKAKLRQ